MSKKESYMLIILCIISAIVICSCKQEFIKLNDYIDYKIIATESGDIASEGQYVYFHYVINAGDSTIYDSRKTEVPQKFKIPATEQFSQIENPAILMLQFLSKGDSAVVQYKLKEQKKYPKEYEGLKRITYHIKILDIVNEASYVEKQSLKREGQLQDRQDYYDSRFKIMNQIDSILRILIRQPDLLNELSNGIKYVFVNLNNNGCQNSTRGVKLEKGEKIKFSYILFDESGNYLFSSFENREPYLFQVGSNKVPPAWNVISEQVSAGSCLIAYIPSALGYGTEGFTGNINIAPNSNLYCYIQIEDH